MSGWPVEYARRVLSTVDSTNAEAARIAPDMLQPTWILALQQTAGRGRRGRPWNDPPGNFAATLVLHPTEAPHLTALRSFVAALALHDAFVTVSGRPEAFALKWPNDVLLNGGKVAGILLESLGTFRGASYLAIGIGVNLMSAPSAEQVEARAVGPVSLLSETGAQVTPEEFLEALAESYASYEAQFKTYGFEAIRQAWLRRAAKLGEVITARTGNTERTGTFETLDEHGNLVLRTAQGREAIPAADVFF